MNPDDDATSVRSSRSAISRKSVSSPQMEKVVCIANDDSVNIEFVYYTSMIKKFAPSLSKEKDKEKVIPWIRKLYAPEYATEFFKIKRNRYLFAFTLTILNDEMYGVFKTIPPAGPLKTPESIAVPIMPLTTWEIDRMWEEVIVDEDKDNKPFCSMHEKCPEEENEEGKNDDEEEKYLKDVPEEDRSFYEEKKSAKSEKKRDEKNKKALLSSLLDWEFQYLLHIVRPYAALITNVSEKAKVAKWLQKLCGIRMDMACSKMKGVRNDYIMALIGFLYNLRLAGPFENLPPNGPLESLEKAMDKIKDGYPLTVPTQNDVDEFLADQPPPADGGAFCYIAISGDLQATDLIKSKPVQTKNCSKTPVKTS